MLSSRYRFFLAVSLFCLTNQYKVSGAREHEPRLDPRKWKLRSTQIGVAEASLAPVKQHDTSVTKPDRTMLGIYANTQSPAAITDDVFESGNQRGADANKHSYASGLGRNDRPHRAQMRRRHGHSVVKSRRRRFRRGIFTTTLDTQFETNDTAGKGNRIHSKESYKRGMTINMTLSVPKLEMCVHICLSNTLCTNASFHAEKSTCTLTGNGDDRMEEKRQRVKDKNDEIGNKWRGPIEIKIRISENGETKTFRINKSKLKVGKASKKKSTCSYDISNASIHS
ncbi:unnamed protein product [Acanthosepion pharaonis]|uniref:Apple domain-containing protein n=1 Tax=Acanthosepion pharaonis TaxID=158019 RepID=A0A812CNY8_ACAPH|nr:unnamed protein product [Sepia pharaonis]